MEVFYIAVLAIATGILILILTSVGVLIRKGNTEAPWPPTAGRCPDRWVEKELNQCIVPDSLKDTKFITETGITAVTGTAVPASINFTGNACDKKAWAKKWNVKWDGVTNYNKC
jgi:hypothetical protein